MCTFHLSVTLSSSLMPPGNSFYKILVTCFVNHSFPQHVFASPNRMNICCMGAKPSTYVNQKSGIKFILNLNVSVYLSQTTVSHYIAPC